MNRAPQRKAGWLAEAPLTADLQAIILFQFSDHNSKVKDLSSNQSKLPIKGTLLQTETATKWIDQTERQTTAS